MASYRLIEFDNSRDRSLHGLYTDPEKELNRIIEGDSIVEFDRNCMCNMGGYELDGVDHSKFSRIDPRSVEFSCDNCREMSSYVDLRKNAERVRFMYPSSEGRPVSVKKYNSPRLYFEEIGFVQNRYVEDEGKTYVRKIRTFITDRFTSHSINYNILNQVQEGVGMTFVPKVLKSFVCGKDGFSLEEDPPNGSLSLYNDYPNFFTVSNCRSILFQLISSLHFLRKRDFFTTNPSIESLSVSKRAQITTTKYMGKSVETDISIKLNRNTDSTVDGEGVRIIGSPVITIPERFDLVYKSDDKFQIPIIDEETDWKNISESMRFGHIDEATSICTYMFLLSFFSMSGVSVASKNDPLMRKVWECMWEREDFVRISNEMKIARSSGVSLTSSPSIFKMIQNTTLKKDITNDIMMIWE